MTTAATIVSKLVLDNSEFESGISGAAQATDTFHGNFTKKMQDIGATLTHVGGLMTATLTAPLLGAGAVMIGAASDYDESLNKVNVVFGTSGQVIDQWSKDAATSLGMSAQQALEAAGTYGNLFTALGMGKGDAADMSMSLVQLASDLASFNNANPEDVLLALRSGLSGEIEPMKKFGVAMNEAMMKQKAMELGLGDNVQGLTEAQKVQVRYALMMEQTATAQGDFARTSDGMANSTRIAKAQLLDAAAVLGAQLLPYALKLVDGISKLVTWFQTLNPQQQKWILIIGAVVAAIGPLLMIVGSLITTITALAPVITAIAGLFTFPLIAIIAAVIAVVALLYAAWTNNWGGIQEKTAAVIEFVRGVIESGMQFITDLTTGQLGEWSAIWDRSTSAVRELTALLFANIKLIFAAFKAVFEGDWRRLGEILRQIWKNAWDGMVLMVKTAWENIKSFVSGSIDALVGMFEGIDWMQIGYDLIAAIGEGMLGALPYLLSIAGDIFAALSDFFSGLFGGGSGTGGTNPIPTPDTLQGNGERIVRGRNGLGLGGEAMPTADSALPRGGTAQQTNNYYNPQITIVTAGSQQQALKGLV